MRQHVHGPFIVTKKKHQTTTYKIIHHKSNHMQMQMKKIFKFPSFFIHFHPSHTFRRCSAAWILLSVEKHWPDITCQQTTESMRRFFNICESQTTLRKCKFHQSEYFHSLLYFFHFHIAECRGCQHCEWKVSSNRKKCLTFSHFRIINKQAFRASS